jgi:catechol 2,3-dioxygenase-like lactoylglutathione lyase family enzyme
MATWSIHHTSLAVGDADASLKFYRDGLGLKVVNDVEEKGERLSRQIELPEAWNRLIWLATAEGETLVELLEYKNPRGKKFDLNCADIGSPHISFWSTISARPMKSLPEWDTADHRAAFGGRDHPAGSEDGLLLRSGRHCGGAFPDRRCPQGEKDLLLNKAVTVSGGVEKKQWRIGRNIILICRDYEKLPRRAGSQGHFPAGKKRGNPRADRRKRRGKSTIMNILGGLLQKDEGTIFIDGAARKSKRPAMRGASDFFYPSGAQAFFLI